MTNVGNTLLQSLAPDDRLLLRTHLEPVFLVAGEVLFQPGKPIESVFFLEQSVCSVLAVGPSERVEVSKIGHEGLTGLPAILGQHQSLNLVIVEVSGSALRVPAAILRSLMDQRPSLRNLLLDYVHTVMVQLGHNALAMARFDIVARLARQILMRHDRLGRNDMRCTHDGLAKVLGVRRSGITNALHALEGEQMIYCSRTNIKVLDREKLKAATRGCYGVPENEYDRVIKHP